MQLHLKDPLYSLFCGRCLGIVWYFFSDKHLSKSHEMKALYFAAFNVRDFAGPKMIGSAPPRKSSNVLTVDSCGRVVCGRQRVKDARGSLIAR